MKHWFSGLFGLLKLACIIVSLFYLITNNKLYSYYYMKVVNTSDTSHTIRFIPRLYILTGTTLELKNEANKEVTTVVHEIAGSEAILSLIFDFTFTEGARFQIKLYDATGDIYRGRILATDQTVQEYDTTLDYYTYE